MGADCLHHTLKGFQTLVESLLVPLMTVVLGCLEKFFLGTLKATLLKER
jgi:hypothetical protein